MSVIFMNLKYYFNCLVLNITITPIQFGELWNVSTAISVGFIANTIAVFLFTQVPWIIPNQDIHNIRFYVIKLI